jgi:phage tail sheath protein FI
MPVTVSYPGVYVEEIPSGVHTITGVSTSITAFVGRALRGPTDKAVTINSFGDFERTFGGLWVNSAMSFAVRDFYLNGGSQGVIVRIFHPQFDVPTDRDPELALAKAAASLVVGAAVGANAAAAAAAALAKAAEIQGGAGKPSEKAAAAAVARAAAAAAQVKGATAGTVSAAATAAVDEAAGKAAGFATASLTVDTGLTLEAAYPGAWGNSLRARVNYATRPLLPGEVADSLFNLFVFDGQAGQVEEFRNVSITPGHPRQVDKVVESESRLVRTKNGPWTTRPKESGSTPDKNKGIWDDTEDPAKATNSKVKTDFASDGAVLKEMDLIGDEKKGLLALKKVDLFNLLCIPPYKDGDIDALVLARAISFCQERRAFLLIDPLSNWNDKEVVKTDMNTDKLGAANSYSAVFFPRLRQPNPLRGGAVEDFVPCGAVAGVFARTDAQRGVWKAPAGLEATLIGVPELSVKLNDPENGELNLLGVNCLRSMPAAGPVVWGSRTREGDNRLASQWKYIPVRRTALFIEESLYRGTQWVVFEPNDEPLWAQIRLNVGAFMNGLFRRGAFQGSSPRDAYLVKCDKETNPQSDINLGIVNIHVGFAPLKPAEFVILKIQQLAGRIET